jgi:hypothetical protein
VASIASSIHLQCCCVLYKRSFQRHRQEVSSTHSLCRSHGIFLHFEFYAGGEINCPIQAAFSIFWWHIYSIRCLDCSFHSNYCHSSSVWSSGDKHWISRSRQCQQVASNETSHLPADVSRRCTLHSPSLSIKMAIGSSLMNERTSKYIE